MLDYLTWTVHTSLLLISNWDGQEKIGCIALWQLCILSRNSLYLEMFLIVRSNKYKYFLRTDILC